MKNQKGQAAMEFLMTYGWAILAAVIAIGVLAYFGVFSPGKYTTGTAVVNPPFYVNAKTVTAATGISLELKNNGGMDYTINSVAITGCGTNSSSTTMPANAQKVVSITCSPALTAGNSFKGDITISYTKTGSALAEVSTGTIADKVA